MHIVKEVLFVFLATAFITVYNQVTPSFSFRGKFLGPLVSLK